MEDVTNHARKPMVDNVQQKAFQINGATGGSAHLSVGYHRWFTGKPDRSSTGNSVRPSCTGSGSKVTAAVNATTTVNATKTAAPQSGQPQLGPSSVRLQSSNQPDPEIREFRRNEHVFDYRRFSKYASETSKRRDTSKPENSAPPSNYDSNTLTSRTIGAGGASRLCLHDHLKVSTCPFVPTTEYQDQYRAWQALPSYPRRETYSRRTQKMDLRTSYTKVFRGLQGDVTASARPPDNLKLAISRFEVPTENQSKWVVPPPQRYKPEYVPPQGKIDFTTSYRRDFKPQEKSIRYLILPRDQIRMPLGAFQSNTTYTSDYSPRSAWGL